MVNKKKLQRGYKTSVTIPDILHRLLEKDVSAGYFESVSNGITQIIRNHYEKSGQLIPSKTKEIETAPEE